MKRYFCVFNVSGEGQPTSCSFEAKHTGDAIIRMLNLAKLESTTDIAEFQIMECLPGNAYREVVIKVKGDRKMKMTPSSDSTPVAAVKSYTPPYTIEVL